MEGLRPSPEHAAAHDVAARYRRTLLNALGLAGVSTSAATVPHPALAWAVCGSMDLSGREDGPPLFAPSCVASCADAALQTFAAVSGSTRFDALSGAQLLGERAAIAGHRRRGRISAGGSCRLLRTRDHWIAVNLARDEDIALVPAWLETGAGTAASSGAAASASTSDRRGRNGWTTIEAELAHRDADEVVARGRELGLPLARLAETKAGTHWTRIARRGTDREPNSNALPLVIDLSSLWAGPLATHLFERAGARVIKVESRARPDGARRGPIAFYDLLNAGKQSVALDFGSHDDLVVLDRLLRRADIVVEASRPRALRQLGFDAEQYLRTVPGLTWLSITGYGRDEPFGDRVAFGDDAAVAGGLVCYDGSDNAPVFCGDAVGDPLTGLHAALAAYGSWRIGGGRLLDIAMSNVAAHVRGYAAMPDDCAVGHGSDGMHGNSGSGGSAGTRRTGGADGYRAVAGDEHAAVLPPRARAVERKAAELGADTRAVIDELCKEPC